MGWRGTLRSLAAASRQIEREQKRAQRELLTQQRLTEKLESNQRAALEVAENEYRIQLLQTIHRDCSPPMNWESVLETSAPLEPEYSNHLERVQRIREDGHMPTWVDKFLRREHSKLADIAKRIEDAKEADSQRHEAALEKYKIDLVEWQNLRDVAVGVLNARPAAFVEAVRATNVLKKIHEIGSMVSIKMEEEDPRYIEASLSVHGDEVIPKDVKTLLKSGNVSVKKMPVTQFYALYQDHVCSAALRIARELFALLPLNFVFVHAEGEVLNPQTGHQEVCVILSVAVPRATLAGLNFSAIDPSDSMRNFVHRMQFSKQKGFGAVEALSPSGFSLS